MRGYLRGALLIAGIVVFATTSRAQTPDGQTPAEEEACDKYQGQGARYGLCVAYCEAQDCETTPSAQSCINIQESFREYSFKKGYEPGDKKKLINCRVTACSPEDVKACGGKEIDCLDRATRVCETLCSSTFLGLDDRGNPICTKVAECIKCEQRK